MANGALRFATLNTWKNEGDYFARLEAMATGLQALAPDVVLLQEVFRTADETSVLRRTADTAQSLARALDFAVAYAPARRKPRRWGGAEVPSEAGLAILVRGRIAWQERLSLPSDERGGERIALLAEVVVRDIPCLVACVHLSHLRDDDARRREQLETVLAQPRWEQLCGVVGGDFNCTLAAPALAAAREHPRLVVRSVFEQERSGGFPGTTTGGDTKRWTATSGRRRLPDDGETRPEVAFHLDPNASSVAEKAPPPTHPFPSRAGRMGGRSITCW